MKKYKDPGVRDVKQILAELNFTVPDWGFYNDRYKCENRRRIKIPVRLGHTRDIVLQKLSERFPAHTFAIGERFSDPHGYWNRPARIVTAIYVWRDNQKYDELFPEKKEVVMTLDEIARLKGCDVSQLWIVP